MDREELNNKLQAFKACCAERGKPLEEFSLVEAYPGVSDTSFIIQVRAPWDEDKGCYEAIQFLCTALWDTTDEITRRSVFCFKVLESKAVSSRLPALL